MQSHCTLVIWAQASLAGTVPPVKRGPEGRGFGDQQKAGQGRTPIRQSRVGAAFRTATGPGSQAPCRKCAGAAKARSGTDCRKSTVSVRTPTWVVAPHLRDASTRSRSLEFTSAIGSPSLDLQRCALYRLIGYLHPRNAMFHGSLSRPNQWFHGMSFKALLAQSPGITDQCIENIHFHLRWVILSTGSMRIECVDALPVMSSQPFSPGNV